MGVVTVDTRLKEEREGDSGGGHSGGESSSSFLLMLRRKKIQRSFEVRDPEIHLKLAETYRTKNPKLYED